MSMKEEIIGLIVEACENEDEDFLDMAIGIVDAEGNKFSQQIDTLCQKIFQASKEERDVEGLLDVVVRLLDEGQPAKASTSFAVEPEVRSHANTMKTKKAPVNQMHKGENLFDPNEYKHLYHDEDHKAKKAASRPTPKPEYKNTVKIIECSNCDREIEVPKDLYVEGTGLKCDRCLMG